MNDLFTLIRKSIAIDHETESEISSHLSLQKVSKGRILVSVGDKTDKVYFLKNGLVREYYNLWERKEEITSQIVGENTFFYSTLAYLSGKPSERQVETLENSELISIRKESLFELCNRFPPLGLFIQKMQETALINFEKRLTILRLRSPLEKLEVFEKIHPEFSNRLPLGIMASYLGIAPQTLSTTRSKRRKD